MKIKLHLIIFCFLSISNSVFAQDDLLAELEKKQEPLITFSTFKGTRTINGQSIETRKKKTMVFIISHRFGKMSDGVSELFGLDQANVRFGLDYSISDDFTVGIGRSSFQKVYDGYLKYKILKQSSKSPITITAFTDLSVQTLKAPEGSSIDFGHRLSYAHQILIARKFSKRFSFQLSPTLIHQNLTTTPDSENDTYAMGFAARYKLSKRVSLNSEYFWRMNNRTENYYDAFALGVDIETGGHVFQLHITNAQSMVATGFVPGTTGNFFDGNIHLGFNVTRAFSFGKR